MARGQLAAAGTLKGSERRYGAQRREFDARPARCELILIVCTAIDSPCMAEQTVQAARSSRADVRGTRTKQSSVIADGPSARCSKSKGTAPPTVPSSSIAAFSRASLSVADCSWSRASGDEHSLRAQTHGLSVSAALVSPSDGRRRETRTSADANTPTRSYEKPWC